MLEGPSVTPLVSPDLAASSIAASPTVTPSSVPPPAFAQDITTASQISGVPQDLVTLNMGMMSTLGDADKGQMYSQMLSDTSFMGKYNAQQQPPLPTTYDPVNAQANTMMAAHDAQIKLNALYTPKQQAQIATDPAKMQEAAQKLMTVDTLKLNEAQTKTFGGLDQTTSIADVQNNNADLLKNLPPEVRDEMVKGNASINDLMSYAQQDALTQMVRNAAQAQALSDSDQPQQERHYNNGSAALMALGGSAGGGIGLGAITASAAATAPSGGGESSSHRVGGGSSYYDKHRGSPSDAGDIPSGPVTPGTLSSRQREAMEFFTSKEGGGWTADQAAGIVSSLTKENGAEANLNHTKTGDGGLAYGLAQWHPDRQAIFLAAYGKDIHQATFKEQLQFVNYELHHSEKNAGQALAAATDARTAGRVVAADYERPLDKAGAMASRGQLAAQLAAGYKQDPTDGSNVHLASFHVPNPGNEQIQKFDLAFGDSIAGQMNRHADVPGTKGIDFQDGISPKMIFKRTQAVLAADPAHFEGKNILLSSGSNNTAELDYVGQTIKLMKEHGAKSVTALGMGDRPDLRAANGELGQVVVGAGGKFAGALGATVDGIHPAYHTKELDKALVAHNSSPEMQTTTTAANTPKPTVLDRVSAFFSSATPEHPPYKVALANHDHSGHEDKPAPKGDNTAKKEEVKTASRATAGASPT